MGPAPVRSGAPGRSLSGQRATVLERLQQATAPATVTAMADELRLHANTVREHLDALVAARFAVRDRAPAAGRGRPAWQYTATDLVVEAKRARAGRSLFLPGGWLEQKTPRLPAESWKTALVPWDLYGFVVPDRPVAQLFAAAWQRVVDGDAPGFEEFKGRSGRGGSR